MNTKRTLLLIITVLIMLIIISLAINVIMARYSIISINEIYLDGDKVIISKLANQQLNEIYTEELKTEIPSCLAGEITKEGIRIDNVEKANIVKSTPKDVTYIQCPTRMSNKFGNFRVFGTIHNHINGNCMLSTQDLETYVSDIRQGQEVIGLICGEGKIFFVLSKFLSQVEEW